MKKPIIIIFTFVILSFFLLSRSFAVCIMPPGYNPADDPDINLDLSGWGGIDGLLDQFVFDHPTDPNAPQLSTLIAGLCDLDVTSVNMISGTGRPPAPDIPADYANLICLSTPVGASVLVPNSGYSMGGGCEAVVLYATSHSIVLKYTPDDNIVSGYTVYLNNFQVDSGLLAFYNAHAWDGSGQAPCLAGGERIGVSGGEICVAIRDTGTYMDPRWQEWWNQCPASALNLILKLIDICMGELPPPGECVRYFPEPTACCPITHAASAGGLLSWLNKIWGQFFNAFGEFAWDHLKAWFTLSASITIESPKLERATTIRLDTNYFGGNDVVSDARLIHPLYKPPSDFYWGTFGRLRPPNLFSEEWAAWARHMRTKWEIPLGGVGIESDPIWGDSEDFAFYKIAADYNWGWLANTPGSSTGLVGSSDFTSWETGSALGLNNLPQPSSSPKTRPNGSAASNVASTQDGPNSPQTLGTQSAQAPSGSALAEEAAPLCNPPYPPGWEAVCTTDTRERVIDPEWLINHTWEVFKGILTGRYVAELLPSFSFLDRITTRLTGVEPPNPDNPLEGGALEIFFPPGSEPFPVLDAPSDLDLMFNVTIEGPCVFPFHPIQCCTAGDKPMDCPDERTECCSDCDGCVSDSCRPGDKCQDVCANVCPGAQPGCQWPRMEPTCKRVCCLTNECKTGEAKCLYPAPQLRWRGSMPIVTEHGNLLIKWMGIPPKGLEWAQQLLAPL